MPRCKAMSAFANNVSNNTVPDVNKILIAVFPALLTVLTVIGNSIVILVIVADRKLFHKQSSLLIMNLAVADLLVGTVVMPLALMMLLTDGNWPLGFEMCRFWISMDVICSTASIVTLCVISVQRLHAIMNPLACITSRSRGKIWFSIAIIWLYSLAVLLICLKYDTEVETKNTEVCFVGYQLNHLLLSVMLSFYIPLLLIIVVSCKITLLLNARRRNLATKRQSKGTGLRIHYGSDESTSGIQKALAKQQNKTYRTLAYVIAIFFACWLPFFIVYPINYALPDAIPSSLVDAFTWLGYSNSICNVVIYAVKMKDFALACKKLTSAVGLRC
ncbi:Alpha-1A adrenergic receptor [Trichinella nelsoni]|uniref:Alpha-1A adrenergic receptor n=1 Tax=Trichinella nelsoni TaxID=6336 RepID=A0A0V0SN00_9BILA|nr:Alpha-1A adrenergic receptor [Trichinella nelsoni]